MRPFLRIERTIPKNWKEKNGALQYLEVDKLEKT